METFNDWVPFVSDFAEAIIQRDAASISNAISTFGDLIPYCGVIGKAIATIIKLSAEEPNPLEEMKRTLDNLNKYFVAMDQKLDTLINRVTYTSTIERYKSEKKALNELSDFIDRYIRNPNRITRNELMDEFKKQGILRFINYIHRELITESLLSITNIMLNEYDLKYFRNWKERLSQDFAQAILMHCLRISILQGTEEEAAVLNNDEEDFITKFKEFLKKLNKLDQQLRNEFWEKKAISEVESFMRYNCNCNHQSFSKQLYQFLTEKYFWRVWVVASWTQRDNFYRQDDFVYTRRSAFYSKYWKTPERRLFVGTSIITQHTEQFLADFDTTVSRVIEETPRDTDAIVWGQHCDDRADRVSDKLWKVIWPDVNGLAVIEILDMLADDDNFYSLHNDNGIVVRHERVNLCSEHIVIAVAKDDYEPGSISANYDARVPRPSPPPECTCS